MPDDTGRGSPEPSGSARRTNRRRIVLILVGMTASAIFFGALVGLLSGWF